MPQHPDKPVVETTTEARAGVTGHISLRLSARFLRRWDLAVWNYFFAVAFYK